jgi:hypothetical protein
MTTEPLWWVRSSEAASEKGPFYPPAIIAAVKRGDMSLRTLVRRDDSDQWLLLRDEPTLRPPDANLVPLSEEAKAASLLVDRITAPRFSWATMLLHFLVITAAFFALTMAFLMASHADPTTAGALGELYGKSIPFALIASYFYQKRSRK